MTIELETSSINEFTRAGSKLSLFVDKYVERPDVAEKALFVGGNAAGFRSLTEIICFSLNELMDQIRLSQIPFVENRTNKRVCIQLEYGDQEAPLTSGQVCETETAIIWLLTETEASVVATSLHGLGSSFEHLHFDPITENLMAAFCYIDTNL